MRITIHRRIFIGMMLVVIGFVVVVNIMIWKLFDDIAYREVLRELEHAVLSYQRFTTRHQDLLITQARAMAETAHLKATLNIPDVDHETVQVVTESLLDVANPDLLIIMNGSGEVLGSVNTVDQNQHNFVNHVDVQQALSGRLISNIWSSPNGVYRIAIAPSAIGELVFGAVIVGYQLDNAKAIQELNDVTGSSVQFFRADKSEAQDPTLTVTTAIDGVPITSIENIPLYEFSNQNGRLLFANIKIPESETSIVLLKELDAVASSIDPIKIAVAAGSVIAILFGLLISNFLALKVSRPITNLTNAASRLGKGELSTRVIKESDDEIGVLSETFNLMADDISTTQKNLLASKEAAEAANRAKSDFLAKMSHEIRTPMNGVIGITELLLRTNLSDKQQKFGETISRSASSLLTIINDILDFSKIEAEKLELESIEFNLIELIEETVDLLKEIASKKGINLVCKLEYGIPLFVIGDPNRLRQVLNNLIHNAIKFTEEGEVCIQVQVSKSQINDSDIVVKFKVTDSGIGISKENQTKIFSSFTQEDDSTTRKYGGTGLGLSICQQLIQLMGGEIKIDSSPGKGSNFNFTLQFKLTDRNDILDLNSYALDDIQLSNSYSENHSQINTSKDASTKLHILLVEDDPINQEVAMGMVSDLDCEVSIAINGVDAINKYQTFMPHVILMDCNMPEMDGYQATQEIRNIETVQKTINRIPIIALTANVNVGDRIKCHDAGMDDYLSKPYTQNALKNILQKWDARHETGPDHHGSAENPVEQDINAPTISSAKLNSQYNSTDLDESILDSLANLPHPSKSNVAEAAIENYLIYAPKILNDLDHTNKIETVRLAIPLIQQLKSSSCSIGAIRLTKLCNEFEQISHDVTIETTKSRLEQIKDSYSLVKKALNIYLTKLRDSATHPVQFNDYTSNIKSESHSTNILLVEDNKVNQDVAIGTLEDMGYAVTVVFNGAQALEALQENHYDLVLMDCQMPEVDGYHATKLIRISQNNGKINQKLKIIAVTANAQEGGRQRCIDAGMDDYLSKPYTYDELNDLVKHWCQDLNPDKTKTDSIKGSGNTTIDAVAKVQINASLLERLHELEQSVSLKYTKNLATKYIKKVSTALLNDLENAIADKNIEAISRASQNLRASTVDLGAKYLGELCLRMESISKFKNFDEIYSLFEDIKIESQEIVCVLHLYLENNSVAKKVANHTQSEFEQEKPKAKNEKLSILLAEDNPINQDVAIGMLNNLGFTVTVVKDGHDAIESFKSIIFDLVFLDVQMPKVDGLTAAGYLRMEEIRRKSEK
ncbi:MAG: response regulator, partial [Gammaproteobacteria bacterium]